MIVIALVLSTIIASNRGLPALKFYLVTLFICIFSLVGGFSYYFATRLYGISNPSLSEIFNNGGLGSFGAYLFGIIGGICLFKLAKVNVWFALDTYTPVIALVHSLGRIACFLGGCCFGIVSDLPWAVLYPSDSPAYLEHLSQGKILSGNNYSLPVHPVQLYESIFCFILFIILLRLINKKKTGGLLFCGYIICYAMLRFFMEFLRDDYQLSAYFLSLPQILSVLFITVGIVTIAIIRSSKKPGILELKEVT